MLMINTYFAISVHSILYLHMNVDLNDTQMNCRHYFADKRWSRFKTRAYSGNVSVSLKCTRYYRENAKLKVQLIK